MSSSNFPYTIQPMEPAMDETLKENFLGFQDCSLEVGPKRFVVRPRFKLDAETIYNFEVRQDDTWIVSYPRSGCTLTQEIVWLILHDDYEKASKIPLSQRFHYLEFSTLLSDDVIEKTKKDAGNNEEKLSKLLNLMKPKWEILESIEGRRFIKTHLPLSLLPPALFTSGAKVIYIARNPKDVAVSRYVQNRSLKLQHFVGDFKTYWDIFENNLLPYSPYWAHVEEGWEKRNHKNFLFLFFEDIIKDYKRTIIQVADFLEKSLNDEQITKLVEYVQIETFRRNHNPTNIVGNLFGLNGSHQSVRNGTSGNWDDYFDKDLSERADKWINEHYKNTTLRFKINFDK